MFLFVWGQRHAHGRPLKHFSLDTVPDSYWSQQDWGRGCRVSRIEAGVAGKSVVWNSEQLLLLLNVGTVLKFVKTLRNIREWTAEVVMFMLPLCCVMWIETAALYCLVIMSPQETGWKMESTAAYNLWDDHRYSIANSNFNLTVFRLQAGTCLLLHVNSDVVVMWCILPPNSSPSFEVSTIFSPWNLRTFSQWKIPSSTQSRKFNILLSMIETICLNHRDVYIFFVILLYQLNR